MAESSLAQIFVVVRSAGPREEMCLLEHLAESGDSNLISKFSFDKFLKYFGLCRQAPIYLEILGATNGDDMFRVESQADWHAVLGCTL